MKFLFFVLLLLSSPVRASDLGSIKISIEQKLCRYLLRPLSGARPGRLSVVEFNSLGSTQFSVPFQEPIQRDTGYNVSFQTGMIGSEMKLTANEQQIAIAFLDKLNQFVIRSVKPIVTISPTNGHRVKIVFSTASAHFNDPMVVLYVKSLRLPDLEGEFLTGDWDSFAKGEIVKIALSHESLLAQERFVRERTQEIYEFMIRQGFAMAQAETDIHVGLDVEPILSTSSTRELNVVFYGTKDGLEATQTGLILLDYEWELLLGR